MANEELRMEAAVVDKFSRPLLDLRNKLKDIKPTEGMTSLRNELQKFEQSLGGLRSAAGTFSGVMGAIGLGGFAAASSLTAFIATMRNLSKEVVTMSQLSREAGIAVNQLRVLEGVGKRFQVAPETMESAISNFAAQMVDIRRGAGDFYGELRQRYGAFAEQLRSAKDNTEALGLMLGFLSKIQDEQIRKEWSAKAFGTSEPSRLFSQGSDVYFKALRETIREIGNLSDDLQKKSSELDRATTRLGEAFEKLKLEVAPPAISLLTQATDAFRSVITAGPSDTWQTTIQELKAIAAVFEKILGKGPASAPWKPSSGEAGALQGETEFERRLQNGLEKGVGDGAKKGIKEGFEGLIQKQSLETLGGGLGGLIQRASLGGSNGGIGSGRGGGGRMNGLGFGGGGGRGVSPEVSEGLRLQSQGAVKGGAMDRAMRLMARLRGHGWTEEAAASAAGQAMQESGVRSDGPAGDGGMSRGMFQWNRGRFAALQKFAAALGKPWNDFDTQVDFFNAETKSHGQGGWRNIKDLREGVRPGYQFEGYGDGSHGSRYAFAQKALEKWRNGGATAIPGAEGGDRPRNYPFEWGVDAARRRPDEVLRLAPGSDLIGDALHRGLFGNSVKVDGGLSVDLNFRNPPPGLNTRATLDGFAKGLKINRGTSMPLASDE